MAIQKSKTLANGATGNYWKVTQAKVDKQAMKVRATMSLFVDQAHSVIASLNSNKIFNISVTKAQLSGDVIALCYTQIKTLNDPDLSGGTDV